MPEPVPGFRYHSDPVKSEVIVASDGVCICCNQARGYMYVGPTYTAKPDVRDNLCPWCVADGSAAAKLDVEFTEGRGLFRANVPREIIDSVLKQTPGYFCWQSQQWQAHCNDACVFHGDATVEDVANAPKETIEAWKTEYDMKGDDWNNLTDGYEPKGHSAFYKFVCRHCSAVRFSWDMD
jgi:uncharacterized protein